MEDQIFTDGIATISVIGSTVRLDFVSLSPTEKDEKGQLKTVPQFRMVMAVDGFMRSAAKIQEAVQAIHRLGSNPQLTAGAPQGAAAAGERKADLTVVTKEASPSRTPFP